MGFTDAYTNEDRDAVISASGILNDGSDTLEVISADLSLDRISIIVNSFIEMDDAFLKNVGAKVADGDYSLTKIDGNTTAFSEISGTDCTAAVEAAIHLANGESVGSMDGVTDDGKYVWVPFEKVDKSNVSDYK